MKKSKLFFYHMRLLTTIAVFILIPFQVVHSQEGNRARLKPSEAIVGRWTSYVKSWLGFGDWKRVSTIAEYRSDGRLIYDEGTGATNLVYSILNQDDPNGTMDLLVQKPSTGGSHVQHIQFTNDRNMFYEQTNLTTKSVRTGRDKTVTMESKYEYLGPPN
jgi:hypothetical protein